MCLKIILKYAYNVYSSFEFFHLRFILFTIYCVVENNRFCQGQGDKFFFVIMDAMLPIAYISPNKNV